MKTSKDLRHFLVDQMEKMASGEVEAANAKGICNYAQQIYNTLNLEIKMALAKQKLVDQQVSPVDFDAD